MSKLPPIPKEQRSFTGENPRDRLRSAEPHRREGKSGENPGIADVDLKKEGRSGARA